MARDDHFVLGRENRANYLLNNTEYWAMTYLFFHGESSTVPALRVLAPHAVAINGSSDDRPGVWGGSQSHQGVMGTSATGNGVFGSARSGTGVYGTSESGYAGYFNGKVRVTGALELRIDSPSDPENKHLTHSFVGSPDVKNIYDGVAHLDEEGAAWIELPEWFEGLNHDFRYHLTAIGSPAPELHVAEEVSGNRFRIAGGEKGAKVCWQVTGIRKDSWAEANRVVVEEDKDQQEVESLQRLEETAMNPEIGSATQAPSSAPAAVE